MSNFGKVGDFVKRPVSASITLNQLGEELRQLAAIHERSVVAIAIRLVKAESLIPATLTIHTWAAKYLRKLDGTPYTHAYINQLLAIGRTADPVATATAARKRDTIRHQSAAVQRDDLAAKVKVLSTPTPAPKRVSEDQSQQVNHLVTAWELAEQPARKQFLHLINARIV
jgi:hypothetical protein